MGRMLEALKRADRTHEPDEPRPVTPASVPFPRMQEADGAEEVPFIEVGPSKSMEASPSVLACLPLSTPSPERKAPDPPPRNVPLAGVPGTPSVHFRAVPSRLDSRSRFASELVAYHHPEQSGAQQYRDLLDAVLSASPATPSSAALLFAAALPRTGTTTTLLNVAITAARLNRGGVVVVDANLCQPAVSDRLGMPSAPGLRDALAGAVSLAEVVRPTEQANLFVLPAGSPAPASLSAAGFGPRTAAGNGTRFMAETMRSLLRQLRQRFSLVLVDGPRWDGRPDVVVLGAACDAVYLVVPEQEAETPQTDALLQLIPQQGAHLAGCILVPDRASFA